MPLDPNTDPNTDPNVDPAQLRHQAADLISRVQLGILTTIDADGFPHARWMSAVALDGLTKLVTLTADGTRKLAQLEGNPRVNWLFSSPDQLDVVQLKGRANIHRSLVEVSGIWERLADATQTFAAGPLSDEEHLQLVTIETQIDSLEMISPRQGIYVPQAVALA